MDALLELLAPDVVFVGDGGGKALAIKEPLHGRVRVARFVAGLFRRGVELHAELRPAWVNGQPGGLALGPDGRVISVFTLDIADGAVQAIRSVVNPDKLVHLGPVSDLGLPPARD
jgi:RNA polymerase sigma-70 factor (ECF subfamily)